MFIKHYMKETLFNVTSYILFAIVDISTTTAYIINLTLQWYGGG